MSVRALSLAALAMCGCARASEPTAAPMIAVSASASAAASTPSAAPHAMRAGPACPGAALERTAVMPYMARVIERVTLTHMPDMGDGGLEPADIAKGVRVDPLRHTMTVPAPAGGFIVIGARRYAIDSEGFVTIPDLPSAARDLPLTDARGDAVRVRLPLDPCGLGVTRKADAPTVFHDIEMVAPREMN